MDCSDLEGFSPTAREHAANPRHYGPLKSAQGHARITGPCGDTMEFWLIVRDGKVEDVSFITDGCGASRACGSQATCLAEGKRVEDAAGIRQQDVLEAFGGFPRESEHCALLTADTLRAACEDYLGRPEEGRAKNSAKKTSGCGTCGDSESAASGRLQGESEEDFRERRMLQSRLCRIRHKVIVLSGKGGVGKSTVAVNLAVSLALSGRRVGLLDVDIHGPSIPTMLGLEGETVQGRERELLPVDKDGLKVMSLGFLLRSPDDAVIWRGPMKMGVIKQFLQDVAWGDLDYLIIDSPPGTGDEPLSVCQLAGALDGAVIVTTPQKVSAVDVRKSITFCRTLHVPVLGVVENMSGFACPKCGEITPIFRSGGGQRIAGDMHVPFLGSIPIDPDIAAACDSGQSFIQQYAASPTAKGMQEIIQQILAATSAAQSGNAPDKKTIKENALMRIAIPFDDGKLSMHFGHCAHFALLDVDCTEQKILRREDVEAPPHEPGLLPKWLGERGANLIIAGGMGQRAQDLFTEQGIRVIVGAPAETPEQLASDYLAGKLQAGENVCDH